MAVDVGVAALLLLVGNIAFRHFEPLMPLWRRVLKTLLILAVTALVSHYFGRTGVLIAFGIALIPVIRIHGIVLPRNGINGLTGEPRARYHEFRGWPPPEN